ncbi:hypothetical protein BEL04_08325 [Mucilaginibacter sp. PPCGB 2223]|uniref:hypothetical protein n=1 Tax=Mucilaginibacter sp. PPCGB 2223 TaxID=1886027 RepID=UPI000824C967|nr:hypothetical protein [Mucilaginibacter sp. PPCGB 2223]OCX54253.1 hypothetical protein BEL04_08325 [Mucilaginibacter sp. PPCGB 2223]
MPDTSTTYISKFAPKSHFITDAGSITQTQAQAFGPVSADVYKLTSNFTISGSGTDVFAACSGVVFIQPQMGSTDKVNVILRPFTQPIVGFNIKYFIYRGLGINDFFAAGKVIAASSSTSDLINSVNASFASFYGTGTVPDFLASFIGYDPANQADSLLLDDFFFKQSTYTAGTEDPGTAYELPKVNLGDSIGTFVAGECGFDIVLNYGDYRLPTPNTGFIFDLAYARAASASIDLSGTSDAQVKKITREHIFQFLDIAAYYGFHTDNNGVVVTDSSGTKVNKTGGSIYTDVLSNFYTKNNLYLYIQSDRTRSYNFYGNYNISATDTNSLLMGATADSLAERTYDTNGWPVIIDHAAQNRTDDRNQLFLRLVTDNNVNTMLYGQVAQIDNAQANNFCDADDLQLPPDTNGNPSTLTKVITLSNPATGPDGAKLNVATFNILIYQGQTYDYVAGQVTDVNGVTTDVLAEPDFFDDVFDLLNATPLLKAGDTPYTTLVSQRVKLINHYYNNTQYGISAVQTTIINDQIDTGDPTTPTLDRVTYISETIDILNDVVATLGTVSQDTQSSPTAAGNRSYSLPAPFYYDLQPFNDVADNSLSINGVVIKTTDNTLPNKIVLGISKTENTFLQAVLGVDNFKNPRLFLVDLFPGANQLISEDGTVYQKFQLTIVGEGTNGELSLAYPDEDVIVYSIDLKSYFSKAYSDYIKSEQIQSLYLDLEISL